MNDISQQVLSLDVSVLVQFKNIRILVFCHANVVS